MKKLSLALVLLSSPAFAQTYGRVHPLAPECVTTDADCIAQHDSRILTLAINMGDAMYCRASTRPAACTEAVEMIAGDYVPAPKAAPSADAASVPPGVTVIDMSGPAEPEAEFPVVAKKGAL